MQIVMSLPTPLNPRTPKLSPIFPTSHSSLSTPLKLASPLNLKFPGKFWSSWFSFKSSYPAQNDDFEDHVIGDCVVFEEGVFEDPHLQNDFDFEDTNATKLVPNSKKVSTKMTTENLVPDKWRQVQAEINISKKERRKIAQEMEFNSRLERKTKGLLPLRHVNLEEYKEYQKAKLAQLKPLIPDSRPGFQVEEEEEEKDVEELKVNEMKRSLSERVAPKNPRWAVYGRGMEDVSEFFNSGNYQPGGNKTDGPRKLFTKEEKVLLNRRKPDLEVATCSKWLPLHTLAASGEYYLMDALLKHDVDINAVDKDGLTALHRAVVSKKQAITNYLLRESANPLVRDTEGATLLHYAVQTASTPAIKILLLYNVDINLQDNDGWTPLHLAVQARRTDIVRLLLIKGADKTLKNRDGLTPLDICLYSGRDTRTYELIKLLKQTAKPR